MPQKDVYKRQMSAQAYLPHMLRDKKVLAGEMRLILPLAIGKSEVRSGVSHELVLNEMCIRDRAHMMDLLEAPDFNEARNVSALFLVREWLKGQGRV